VQFIIVIINMDFFQLENKDRLLPRFKLNLKFKYILIKKLKNGKREKSISNEQI
jgi:hypothetical protein